MVKYGAQDRRDLAKKGHALPDGSFPIVDDEDLRSAIRNWALGHNPDAAKRHIIKRARAMNSFEKLPEKWRATLSSSTELQHFGIKGMKWGVRRADPDRAARRSAREIESGLRGRATVRASDVFNSPSAAVGKAAVSSVLGGVGVGLAVRSLTKPQTGSFRKVKVGLAVVGVIMSAVGVASQLSDARDIRNYQKNKLVVDRIARQRDIEQYGR